MRGGRPRPERHNQAGGDLSAGVLYVVATPIGNLEDLSPRAARVLAEADLIACEDTRHTAHLLAGHKIRTPAISYFEHNEDRRTPELLERLISGAAVALVSDAGTPAISDPGFRLVRAALDAGIRVRAIPGPSAAIAALSIAGLPTDRFVFEGFLPQRAGPRLQHLKTLTHEPRTMIFYEAARRLAPTLDAMASIFTSDRQAAIVREITKTFEETLRGSIGELQARIAEAEPRGEITLIVAGAPASSGESTSADGASIAPIVTIEILREAGLSLKQASAVIAKLTGASRREIYQRALRDHQQE
ncbi:MAG TPA: 16S rRNA (cytidine(1402)-2'-O)-methyltransferase [Candidatus Binataceae bacterium]|nr:16S rRNA (cytidine(1402)-2'-O)-methyltransferase [Candidatus Binataceae bacterium]